MRLRHYILPRKPAAKVPPEDVFSLQDHWKNNTHIHEQLNADISEEEMEVPSSEDNSNRQITINWDCNGAKRRIHVLLAKQDYMQACDAHRDGKCISITGIPEKQGKIFSLMNPEKFSIL